MREWEQEALEVSKKAKGTSCTVAVAWDGKAWERLGNITGRDQEFGWS